MTAEDAGLLVIADEVERLVERARVLVAKGAPPGRAARAVLATCEPAQLTALAWAALAGAVAQDPEGVAAHAPSGSPTGSSGLATN